MLNNNIKPRPTVGDLKNNIPPKENNVVQNEVELTPQQKEQKFNAMLESLNVIQREYVRKQRLEKVAYNGIQFVFAERVNYHGKSFIVISLFPKEKAMKIMAENDFIEDGLKTHKPTIYIRLPEYALHDNLRNLKKPIT